MLAKIFIGLIHIYRYGISCVTKPSCRFEPTCSRYAILAIEYYGVRKGLVMAIKRLLKCHPWSKECGYDPVNAINSNFRTNP